MIKRTGLELCVLEVASAKIRCGLGSLLELENVSYTEWQDWQSRLLSVEEEMRERLVKNGTWIDKMGKKPRKRPDKVGGEKQ